jgi:PelA/Pel-15E family pectate lyase
VKALIELVSGFKTLVIIAALLTGTAVQLSAQDAVADNMVVYQRAWGGWPKHINEVKIDYNKPLFEEQKHDIIADSLHPDCTIDNGATVKEIRYLADAYKKYKNPAYVNAVNKGIRYLLKAQYPVGGWPQFYPDSSLYRSQITYNDDAMVNVLNLLFDATHGLNNMDVVDASYQPAMKNAIDRGVNCILLTQIKVSGKLTAWCAQYNHKTLKPEMARKFELASLSGSESVGIVEFLMRLENPSKEVKQAIAAAVDWFNKVKITGYNFVTVQDPSQPKGVDRVLKADPSSTIWARFYEIQTNEPFFSGRDSVKKKKVSEIEYERRTGYAWYGTWPKKLLEQDYPEWLKKHQG